MVACGHKKEEDKENIFVSDPGSLETQRCPRHHQKLKIGTKKEASFSCDVHLNERGLLPRSIGFEGSEVP